MNTKIIRVRSILNERYVRDHLTKFFRTTLSNYQYVDIIIKGSGYSEEIFYSLSKLTTLDVNNITEKNNFINQVILNFNKLDESYETNRSINNKIYINYKETSVIEYKKYIRNTNLHKKYEIKQEISLIKNIPYNTNYKGLGSFIPSNIKAGNYKIIDVIFDDNINYIIVNQLNFNVTEVSIFYKDSKTLIFTDSISKKDKIERCYGSGEVVYFEENMPFFFFDENIQKPVYKKDKKGNFTKDRTDIIKPINSLINKDKDIHLEKIVSQPNLNIVTLDIETYLDNNIYKILSVCFGRDSDLQYQFYIGDYKSETDFLNEVFNKLFSEEFNGAYVYIHNGVNFDLIFVVKYLLSRKDIEISPIYKDGKFISLTISYGKYKNDKGIILFKYNLTIRDSLLLLLTSLAKLGKSFDVMVQKDIFPYYFPNKDNFNYVGEVPAYKFFG